MSKSSVLVLKSDEDLKAVAEDLPPFKDFTVICYDIPTMQTHFSRMYKQLVRMRRGGASTRPSLFIQYSIWAVPNNAVSDFKQHIEAMNGKVFSFKVIAEENWREVVEQHVNWLLRAYKKIEETLNDIEPWEPDATEELKGVFERVQEIDDFLRYYQVLEKVVSTRKAVIDRFAQMWSGSLKIGEKAAASSPQPT